MTTATLLSRVVPPPLVGLRAQRLLERNVLVYRRAWLVVLSGFFEPVFYLFSIGIGIGELATSRCQGADPSHIPRTSHPRCWQPPP